MPNDKFAVVGTNIAEKATMIWNVADMLRGPFKPHEYGLVILPMTVIRRLDVLLEDTKEAVLSLKKQLTEAKIDNQYPALCHAAGQAFCNASAARISRSASSSRFNPVRAEALLQ